jgi:hypothetical protein
VGEYIHQTLPCLSRTSHIPFGGEERSSDLSSSLSASLDKGDYDDDAKRTMDTTKLLQGVQKHTNNKIMVE